MRGETKFVLVLNAACMHVVLHYVSLSHISVLLLVVIDSLFFGVKYHIISPPPRLPGLAY